MERVARNAIILSSLTKFSLTNNKLKKLMTNARYSRRTLATPSVFYVNNPFYSSMTISISLVRWARAQSVGSVYCVIVVPCYNCIQSLDVFKLIESTNIQRLDTTVTRYHSCTISFPQSIILKSQIIKPLNFPWCRLHMDSVYFLQIQLSLFSFGSVF